VSNKARLIEREKNRIYDYFFEVHHTLKKSEPARRHGHYIKNKKAPVLLDTHFNFFQITQNHIIAAF